MEEALTALLAPFAGGHRYWTRAPRSWPDSGVRPPVYIVLQRAGGAVDYHWQGQGSLEPKRVQVDVYGGGALSVLEEVRHIRRLLSGYRGGGFRGIFIDSDNRDLPASDAGEVTDLYRTSFDIIVHYSE